MLLVKAGRRAAAALNQHLKSNIQHLLRLCALTLALIAGVFVGSAAWEFTNDAHNRFVKAFNDYSESRNRGVLDLRKVRKVRAAWRGFEKSEGWPDETRR